MNNEWKELLERYEVRFPSRFDNLTLQTARDCPRRFLWRHLLHLTRLGDSGMSLPAAFGIALHKGVEVLWHGESLESAHEAALVAFNEVRSTWGERPPYTPEHLAMALMQWKEQFQESNELFHFEAPEVGFIFPLTEEYDYYGRIDGYYQRDGQWGVYELKTTKSASYILENPHNQLEGYMVAISQFRGEALREATVDVLQLHVGDVQCFRRTTVRSEERLQDWYQETLFLVTYLRQCYERGVFPKNTGHCSAWGGCLFRDLCGAQSVATVEKLLPMYDVQEWKPWEEDEASPPTAKKGGK